MQVFVWHCSQLKLRPFSQDFSREGATGGAQTQTNPLPDNLCVQTAREGLVGLEFLAAAMSITATIALIIVLREADGRAQRSFHIGAAHSRLTLSSPQFQQ